MKTPLLTLLIFMLFSVTAFSQIPNASFEFWTNSLIDDWTTNSAPPTLMPVSQSTDAYAGTYAAKGQVVNYLGTPYPPEIMSYGMTGQGFPITQRYASLSGWIKASLLSSDSVNILVEILDSTGSNPIGYGTVYLGSAASYTPFDIPIYYFGLTPPAFALITFTIANSVTSTVTVGSYFIVDDLSFTSPLQIGKINSTIPFNVVPNPASDIININGDFNAGQYYNVRLISSTGKLVLNTSLKSSTQSLPPVDVSEFPVGSYFLFISDSKNTSTKQILINR